MTTDEFRRTTDEIVAHQREALRERLASPPPQRPGADPRIAQIEALVAAAYTGPASPADVVTWFIALVANEIDLDLVAKRAEAEMGRLVAFAFQDVAQN